MVECTGEYEERQIVHTVRYRGQVIVIDHVPAEVCSICGDVLLKPETVRRIEELVARIVRPTRRQRRFVKRVVANRIEVVNDRRNGDEQSGGVGQQSPSPQTQRVRSPFASRDHDAQHAEEAVEHKKSEHHRRSA